MCCSQGLGLGIRGPGLGSSLGHLLLQRSVPQCPHLQIGRSDEMMDVKGFGQLGRVACTLDIMVWGQLDTLKRGRERGRKEWKTLS